MTDAGIKLLRWVLFGVVVSTLPIAWAAGSLFVHDKPILVKELLGNGDLLMATCAGCAVALGEIIGSSETAQASKITFGFFALLVIIGSCLVFASITDIRPDKVAYEVALDRFESLSIVLFSFGTISGAAAVWVSEG
jgi:hypothetical protein